MARNLSLNTNTPMGNSLKNTDPQTLLREVEPSLQDLAQDLLFGAPFHKVVEYLMGKLKQGMPYVAVYPRGLHKKETLAKLGGEDAKGLLPYKNFKTNDPYLQQIYGLSVNPSLWVVMAAHIQDYEPHLTDEEFWAEIQNILK